MDLNTFWFILMGALLTGYAILDGFDLGVGILHLFVKKDEERRLLMNSIGPLWDGNEVWLVTFGGALFAAFPHAYATAFSGFYLPFMLLLFALIFRAVSMEFRSKQEMRWWRQMWDVSFTGASTLATFLFGVAVGNMMKGLPIGPDMEYTGGLFNLLGPFPLLTGVLAVATFAMHGSIYLYLKTEGNLQKRIQRWMWTTFGVFLVLYMLTTMATLVMLPSAVKNFQEIPWAWVVVVLNVLAIANIPRAIYLGKPGYAFISSAATIAALTFLFGFDLFPNMIVSSIDPAYNLTIYNAASSQKTLGIMRWIAILGMPFVLSYTVAIYWIFRGKTKLGKFSY
ncbi:cytochrome d ubiquinol oxidase subunit II [bacterium]|nr:cytochrome d ubiquinol oxidase subunit II [bacterium]